MSTPKERKQKFAEAYDPTSPIASIPERVDILRSIESDVSQPRSVRRFASRVLPQYASRVQIKTAGTHTVTARSFDAFGNVSFSGQTVKR